MRLAELELPVSAASDTELPEGWAVVPLRNVSRSRKGKKPTHLSLSPEEQVLPYIDIYAFEKSEARQYADVKSSTVVEAGLLLVVWDGARCGLVGRAPFKGALGSTLLALEVPELDSNYLFWFLRGQFHRINSNPRGTGIPHVDPDVFWNIDLPVPPLAEQRRIVVKVEQVLATANASRERLARIPVLMKRFRQSVLAAACSGRLTADWREQNPDVESAAQLLERILAERRARWEAAQTAKKQGKSPTLPLDMEEAGFTQRPGRLNRFYQEPAAPDASELVELLEGWTWCSAEQVCETISKGTTPSSEKMTQGDGEVPYIKVYNLTFDGCLDFTVNPTFVTQKAHESELARSRVFPGDVLMNIVGPPLGKVSVVPNIYPEWNINQAIAFFRLLPDFSRAFFITCLLTESVLSVISFRAKATAGQHNLTLEQCRSLPLPLPPLAEQQEIVERVERLFRFANAIEKRTAAAATRVDRLTQAVLARAFRGELVPTEAELARAGGRDYEPASLLLERIQAEREQPAGGMPATKGGRSGQRRAGRNSRGTPEPALDL